MDRNYVIPRKSGIIIDNLSRRSNREQGWTVGLNFEIRKVLN